MSAPRTLLAPRPAALRPATHVARAWLALAGAALVTLLLAAPGALAAPKKGAEKSGGGPNKAKAAEARNKGLAAIDAGKEDEAMTAFLDAVKFDPNDAVSHHEIGKMLAKQGKLADAIERFTTSVKLDPKESLAWYNLAYASRKNKQFAEAAEAYKKYSQLVPDDADALFGLAESLRQAGKHEGAIAAYENYIKKETRASEQKFIDRSKERIAELQKAQAAESERKAAQEAAEKKAAEEKAAAEAEQKRVAEEKAAAEKAAAEAEQKRIAEEKAAAKKAAEEKAAAEKEAKRLAAEQAAAEKLAAKRSAEEKAAAEKEAKRLAAEQAAAEQAAAKKAAEEKAIADKEAARLAAEKAAEDRRLAREREKERLRAEDKASLLDGAESAPTPPAAPAAPPLRAPAAVAAAPSPASPRVIVHGDNDKPPAQKIVIKAPGAAEPAPAAAPPPPAPIAPTAAALAAGRIAEGDKAFGNKDYRAALFAYLDAGKADAKSVEARVKAGECYAKLGAEPEAMEQWNQALALDAKATGALEGIAQFKARKAATSAPAPAAAAARPAGTPVANEEEARKRYTAGVGLVRERKFEAAIAELDQAVAAKPNFAVALIARGSAKIGLGRYQDAVVDYSAARTANVTLAAPIFGLAEAYRGLGESAKAAGLYREFAASTAPDAQAQLKQYALSNAQALAPK